MWEQVHMIQLKRKGIQKGWEMPKFIKEVDFGRLVTVKDDTWMTLWALHYISTGQRGYNGLGGTFYLCTGDQ